MKSLGQIDLAHLYCVKGAAFSGVALQTHFNSQPIIDARSELRESECFKEGTK